MAVIDAQRKKPPPWAALLEYERALLADVDATLTRVFTRGAEYARKQGDMRSYRICLKYLQELERSNPRRRRITTT